MLTHQHWSHVAGAHHTHCGLAEDVSLVHGAVALQTLREEVAALQQAGQL